jgi:hypothetical protein
MIYCNRDLDCNWTYTYSSENRIQELLLAIHEEAEDNMTEEWHLLVRLFSFVVISVAYPGIPTSFLQTIGHTSLYFLVRLLGR